MKRLFPEEIKRFFMNDGFINSPMIMYIGEITHDYRWTVEVVTEFLKENGSPSDRVVKMKTVHPIIFYTEMQIIRLLPEELIRNPYVPPNTVLTLRRGKKVDVDAEWFIPNPTCRECPQNPNRFLKGKWELIVLKTSRIEGNGQNPRRHYYSPPPADGFPIWKRIEKDDL
jgi:hypothetical protein